MKSWSRADPRDYRRVDLRAHELLADVPLHDVWQVKLPGGGAERSIEDIRSLMSSANLATINPIVRALFDFRRWLGRVFRWDSQDGAPAADLRIDRLSEQDVRESLVEPGTAEGLFSVLYVRRFEAVSEVRNSTVHAFSVIALQPHAGGYRLFWAIHVSPVGRVTALYMALIDPFRRLVIYPAVLRYLERAWREQCQQTTP